MTDEILKQGEKLQRRIDEITSFVRELEKIDPNKDEQAIITICSRSSLYNASIHMAICPNAVALLVSAMKGELDRYKSEFDAL